MVEPVSPPHERYGEVMFRIRERFDIIEKLSGVSASWSAGETIGLHLRKIVEGVAFGCVIATEHSTGKIPRQAAGHWNAEQVFVALRKFNEFSYPDPNVIRPSTPVEIDQYGAKITIEGVEERRVSVDDLCALYRRTHPWTHEENSYVARPTNEKSLEKLQDDVAKVRDMLRFHRIGIGGKSFICTIFDLGDGSVKVIPLDKVGEL